MNKLRKLADALKPFKMNKISAMYNVASACFVHTLETSTKIMAAENRLAALSSRAFADAFRPTAKAISEMLPALNTETYLSLVDQACEMLASGEDQTDVLLHFDVMMFKLKKGE